MFFPNDGSNELSVSGMQRDEASLDSSNNVNFH